MVFKVPKKHFKNSKAKLIESLRMGIEWAEQSVYDRAVNITGRHKKDVGHRAKWSRHHEVNARLGSLQEALWVIAW
ncbi:8418_t:CDS:2 [Dentiscutata erythropus]|uniref:8418_t:CDS:1 n=1 Tax=Dentiscutata erythropus TaxID=1348616 RepID=A0A9N9AQR3_9GLOM|nr:8418_t:CDS:2 [Dentiscutata erythropus]